MALVTYGQSSYQLGQDLSRHLLHEAGAPAFEPRYFVTRFIFPGCVMSLAFIYLSPSLLVFAHGAAHVVIPALFR